MTRPLLSFIRYTPGALGKLLALSRRRSRRSSMILPRLYALRRCGMKRFCVVLLMFLAGADRIQTFDADPQWEGVNNRVVPKAYPTVVQDFGFSAATNHAGAGAGELGGVVTRASQPAYYGDKVGPLTLDDKLT